MRAPLTELRRCVESLSSETGEYGLYCARTGSEPVPADGLRFENRRTARLAADATRRYRAVLRTHDPSLPYCDPVVHQITDREPPETPTGSTAEG